MTEFNKNTIQEVYDFIKADGLYYVLSYYQREQEVTKRKFVYQHVKSRLNDLVQLLEGLTKEVESGSEHFEKRYLGLESVNAGETLAEVYDFFPKDEYLASVLNIFQEETPFGIYKEISFD